MLPGLLLYLPDDGFTLSYLIPAITFLLLLPSFDLPITWLFSENYRTNLVVFPGIDSYTNQDFVVDFI